MTARSELLIRQPDDWHLHLRDGDMLDAVAPLTARDFARAIIMPNLVPPIVTAADAVAYRGRILAATGDYPDFEPLMTIYLTEATDPDDLSAGAADGTIKAVKLYPAGATTNSDSGVRNMDAVFPVLERMADIGLPLLIHGEVTGQDVDIFDREAVFIETILGPLRARLPNLRIVLEHITTEDGVKFVRSAEGNVAATITPHHLIINRNAIFAGGLRPHNYCLPIAKREVHRLALRDAATSGDPRFFLGTDSAPHVDAAKEAACGCAGVFNVSNTMACLAHVFEQDDALDKLEAFTSLNGPAFYGLPPNSAMMKLTRSAVPHEAVRSVPTALGNLTVFDPGFDLHWSVAEAAQKETGK
jgi:dihydroorotase